MSISVRGGRFSIAADVERLPMVAASIRRLGGATQDAARAARRMVLEPALIATAALDPLGAARVVELAGISVAEAVVAEVVADRIASALIAATAGYRAADTIGRVALPLARALSGFPVAVAREVAAVGMHGITAPRAADAQVLITADPELADLVVDSVAVLRAPVAHPRPDDPFDVTGMAGLLAGAYPGGTATVSAAAPGTPTADDAGPPRGVADLMRALTVRAAPERSGGQIDLRVLTTRRADGSTSRAVLVDLPGTTDWNVLPGAPSAAVTDFGGDVHALAGRAGTYGAGVVTALRRAGVHKDVPVMLVGHSEGGLVAAVLAARLHASGEFHVTHVVTAGAPIAHIPVPPAVRVLSLENDGDVVPHADGADNPAGPNWITVGFGHGPSTVPGRHSLEAYTAGAGDVDESGDESIEDWLSSAAAFLRADSVDTVAIDIGRQ